MKYNAKTITNLQPSQTTRDILECNMVREGDPDVGYIIQKIARDTS